jgi:hypothetical protein
LRYCDSSDRDVSCAKVAGHELSISVADIQVCVLDLVVPKRRRIHRTKSACRLVLRGAGDVYAAEPAFDQPRIAAPCVDDDLHVDVVELNVHQILGSTSFRNQGRAAAVPRVPHRLEVRRTARRALAALQDRIVFGLRYRCRGSERLRRARRDPERARYRPVRDRRRRAMRQEKGAEEREIQC